jgi:hypothetical protein
MPLWAKIIDAAHSSASACSCSTASTATVVELEADAVASSLIGIDAGERGIRDMATVEASVWTRYYGTADQPQSPKDPFFTELHQQQINTWPTAPCSSRDSKTACRRRH